MRDNQRQRVYDAEADTWFGDPSRLARHLSGTVASTGNVSIEACQAYVDAVLNLRAVRSRWGRRSIEARHKVYGSATGGGSSICLPPWARTEKVILHEIAHCLAPSGAKHGPEFVGVLLTLFRLVLGAETGGSFVEACRKYRVRRSMAGVPEPTKPVRTRAEVALAAKVRATTPGITRAELARELRIRIKAGEFGATGTASRRAALDTALRMEKG